MNDGVPPWMNCRVGDAPRAMRRLAVQRAGLVRVLAVAQVGDLVEDHREAIRVGRAGDLVEVGGDLGLVGRDHAERLRGELGAELRADLAALLELGEDLGVVLRAADRGDGRRIPRRCAEERRAADVDHLDRPIDPDERPPDLGAERPDVDDDEVDRLDALALQLVELVGLVAPREDPGVDGVVERLDLAVEHRRDAGQLGDGLDLDAVLGEVLAGPVGGEELDLERLQASRERGDPVPRRDREQRSQPQSLRAWAILGPMASGASPRSSEI